MNRTNLQSLAVYLTVVCICILFTGCSIVGVHAKYSTSGASLSPDVKTVSITSFQNRAPLINPTLARELTDGLREKILSQTRLKMTNGTGDVTFEGAISDYSIKPIAPSSGQTITGQMQRLEVKIQVKFSNSKDSKLDFDQEFTKFTDYPSTQNQDAAERSEKFKKDIITDLLEEIFNKAFVSW